MKTDNNIKLNPAMCPDKADAAKCGRLTDCRLRTNISVFLVSRDDPRDAVAYQMLAPMCVAADSTAARALLRQIARDNNADNNTSWQEALTNVPPDILARYGVILTPIDPVFSVQAWKDDSALDESLDAGEAPEYGCTYTGFLYSEDGEETKDLITDYDKAKVIRYAKAQKWNEVVNDMTGDVVWRKGDK